jgi:hypothetical protein
VVKFVNISGINGTRTNNILNGNGELELTLLVPNVTVLLYIIGLGTIMLGTDTPSKLKLFFTDDTVTKFVSLFIKEYWALELLAVPLTPFPESHAEYRADMSARIRLLHI